MAKKSIQSLLNETKAKLNKVQSIGVQVPSLVNRFTRDPEAVGGQPQNDALVYTVIDIIDEGTDPEGNPTPSNLSFCLPPPIQIIDLHSANWEGIPFGEKIARLNEVKSGASSKDVLVGAVDSAIDFVKKLGKDLYDEIIGNGAKTASRDVLLRSRILGGEDVYNLFSIGTGTAINPNIELAFRSANLRNMQLNFRLVPLSKQDATNIQKFIDRIRLMMYARSDNLWATGYPARFMVQVRTKPTGSSSWGDKVLFSLGKGKNSLNNNYSSCVLTDLQVSYGEGGIYAGHYDGSPGVIDLNLTFQEATLSTRESIQQEYEIKSI